MLNNIASKVGVAVLSALILGLLAVIWQSVSDGALIRAFGGLTKSDVANIASVPSGAVVAFDTETCPAGWTRFAKAHSRVIIGATEGTGFVAEYNADNDLSLRKRGEHGGAENITLTAGQMPDHQHITTPPVVSRSIYGWWFPWGLSENVPKDFGHPVNEENFTTGFRFESLSRYPLSSPAGAGQAHNNMPPYIALYFCKKD